LRDEENKFLSLINGYLFQQAIVRAKERISLSSKSKVALSTGARNVFAVKL
jgi:hypothetical protein